MLGYLAVKALICGLVKPVSQCLSLCLAAWLRVPAVNILGNVSEKLKIGLELDRSVLALDKSCVKESVLLDYYCDIF